MLRPSISSKISSSIHRLSSLPFVDRPHARMRLLPYHQLVHRDFWLQNLFLSNTVLNRLFMSTSSPSAMARHRMPAESYPHQRILMAFPDIDSIGGGDKDDLAGCRREVINIANAIAKYEPVWLHARPADADAAWSEVDQNVTVKLTPVDNLWVRDTGPIFVQTADGDIAGVDFHFNYWGEHAPTTSHLDRSLATRILEESRIRRISAPLTAEGGGIEVDGEGTFMGTESSIINTNRNRGMSKSQVEDGLRSTLGVTKFIWFRGLEFFRGDVTDCDVDALARFAPNDTVLLSRPNDSMPRDDPLVRNYSHTRSVLEEATNAAGRPLSIVELEMPPSLIDEDGYEAVRSYVNYLLVNDAIIVPTFGHEKTDTAALETFRKVFPGRDVVSIPLRHLPRQGGGIHCATQQWPVLDTQ